jgi:hypothetical protein
MNEQIIDELYQLAGGEVPREMIEQFFSPLSPDETREVVELIRQIAAGRPEQIKTGIWNMVLTGIVQKGTRLLYNEKKPAEALAELKKALPYIEHTNDPEARYRVYAYMILAYQAKYRTEPGAGIGIGRAPQEEFVDIGNAFRKIEEIWPECERLGPSENLRRLHESLLRTKPSYLEEALIRLEGYKPLEEISEMKFSNPQGALEEAKKWLAHKDEFERIKTSASAQILVFGLCREFLVTCYQVYEEPSDCPDEDFNYAWGAVQSLRRIWNEYQQEVIQVQSMDPGEMSAEETREFIESFYQAISSEYYRRRGETHPRPQTQTQAQPRSGPCFIATAVYGSANASEVLVLRAFRDDTLLSSKLGRALVDVYYLFSPPVARLLSANRRLRNIVRRAVVEPIANIVRSKFDADKGE